MMPVHLAVAMKNKMLDKLKSPPTGSRLRQRGRKFHDMYIKVHENVRWADIHAVSVLGL